jgi:hypothetical protein
MKAPLFKLTKPEQRVVIFILLALLAGAFVKHYRETHSNSFRPKQPAAATGASPTPTPVPLPDSDDALADPGRSDVPVAFFRAFPRPPGIASALKEKSAA